MFKKFLLIALLLTFSFGAQAGALTAKSNALNASEIQGLSTADTKQVIKADSAFKTVDLQKLALNTGLDGQGKGIAVERTTGCSVGCTVGCTVGCSVGCR